jgi:hypothetical protein
MGCSLVRTTVKARNINEAWKQVYDNAQEYSGHQEGYSGDFNCCDFAKDVTSMLKSKTPAQVDDYIEDNCDKGDAWGYCTKEPKANTNKVKSQVDVTPQKGTRKWETVYKAVTSFHGREVARDKSQTECIKKARAYVEKNPEESLKIIISKELVEGIVQCATVTYKKSTTESLGVYSFVGWAPN